MAQGSGYGGYEDSRTYPITSTSLPFSNPNQRFQFPTVQEEAQEAAGDEIGGGGRLPP
jgi:hypothetical protein